MDDELIEFLERSVVEKKFDAFAGRPLAGLVLSLDARNASALYGTAFPLAQLIELRLMRFFDGFRFHRLCCVAAIMNDEGNFVYGESCGAM